jgi:hypothetical protein
MKTELSALLKQQKEICQLSLKGIKDKLGKENYHVDTSIISRWMSGDRKPNVGQIEALAIVLEIDKSKLYLAAGYPVFGEPSTLLKSGNKENHEINRAQQEHLDLLVKIAKEMLANRLETVTPHPDLDYVMSPSAASDELITEEGIDESYLSKTLLKNLTAVIRRFGQWEVDCLLSHLNETLKGTNLLDKDIYYIIQYEPYTLIETLRTLSHKRNFKGKCHGCPD